jgi:hypothetical protein
MHKYYFLACSLPTIALGIKPDLFFEELRDLLDWSLFREDKKALYDFRQYIDIKNLKRILLGQKIDTRGNLDEKTLNEALLTEEFFPSFVFDFLKKNSSLEERKKSFFLLEFEFLNYQIKNTKNCFLKKFFSHERTNRLIFSALRAKELGRDITEDLKGEDKSDWLIEHISNQRELSHFDPPKGYEKLKEIFVKNLDDPKALNRSFLEYRFMKNIEFSQNDPFTIDQLLGYISNLFLVEDLYYLDEEKAKAVIDSSL